MNAPTAPLSGMTHRDRLLIALDHREPDRVPLDLGSTHVTGIAVAAYEAFRQHLGLPQQPTVVADDVQQIALPAEDLLERLGTDARGLFPLTSNQIRQPLIDAGDYWEYRDEWGLIHRQPKDGGLYFSLVKSPLDGMSVTLEQIAGHAWPVADDPVRIAGLRAQAQAYRDAGWAVVLKGLCAGLCEVAIRIRGMENFLVDLMIDETATCALLDKILELKVAFWRMALAELGDLVDVVLEADDYGTQDSQLVPPAKFRSIFKPRLGELFSEAKRAAPHTKLLFHSCGSVREIIPDFIEIGVDILNPVHVTAAGMEPTGLKRDFGDALCFWGGGVDTQGVLPRGTPAQVREDVRRNVEALMPGGGYVFNTVHNIQADVPPQNLAAMYETLTECGVY
jgi:uroporphyrinogen decarboxylase